MAKDKQNTERGDYKEYWSVEEWVQKIIIALKNWLHRDSACVVSKVPRRTFYDWLKQEDIRTKVEDAEEYWLSIVENKRREKIEEWHYQAIEKELKSKRKAIYGEEKKIVLEDTRSIEDLMFDEYEAEDL